MFPISDGAFGGNEGGLSRPLTPEEYTRLWVAQSQTLRPVELERLNQKNLIEARRRIFKAAVDEAVKPCCCLNKIFQDTINTGKQEKKKRG